MLCRGGTWNDTGTVLLLRLDIQRTAHCTASVVSRGTVKEECDMAVLSQQPDAQYMTQLIRKECVFERDAYS